MRLRTSVQPPVRYEDDAYSRETSPESVSFPDLISNCMCRTHIVPYDPNARPAAFPSNPLTPRLELPTRQHWTALIKQEYGAQELPEKTDKVRELGATDNGIASEPYDHEQSDTAPSSNNLPVAWRMLRPGMQIYIFDSLLLQARYPGIVARALGLTDTELEAILKLRNDRMIQPESTNTIWDRCVALSIGAANYLEGNRHIGPDILATHIDPLIFAEQFEYTTEDQKRLALRFLQERGIQGQVVDALVNEKSHTMVHKAATNQSTQQCGDVQLEDSTRAKIKETVKQIIGGRTDVSEESRRSLSMVVTDMAIAFQRENISIEKRVAKMPLSQKDKQEMLTKATEQSEQNILASSRPKIMECLAQGTGTSAMPPRSQGSDQPDPIAVQMADPATTIVVQPRNSSALEQSPILPIENARPNSSSTAVEHTSIPKQLINHSSPSHIEPAIDRRHAGNTSPATPYHPVSTVLRTSPERPSFSPLTNRSSPDLLGRPPLPSPINIPRGPVIPATEPGGTTPWLSKINKQPRKD